MLEVATKIEFKFHSVDNLKSVNDIYQKIIDLVQSSIDNNNNLTKVLE